MRRPLPNNFLIFSLLFILSFNPLWAQPSNEQKVQYVTESDFLLSTQSSSLKVVFFEPQSSTVIINFFNRNGELVLSESNPPSDSTQTTFTLDLAPLPPDRYTVELKTPSSRTFRNIVIQN